MQTPTPRRRKPPLPPEDQLDREQAFRAGLAAAADGEPASANPHRRRGYSDTVRRDMRAYAWWRAWKTEREARR